MMFNFFLEITPSLEMFFWYLLKNVFYLSSCEKVK